MAYATRQSTISFPKRKMKTNNKPRELSPDMKNSPTTKGSMNSTSSSARKAFHSSASDGIIGRKKELKELKDFLMLHLENQTSGSMYVSGLPGTGKTASVNYVVKESGFDKKYQVIQINCTTFISAKCVFNMICEKLRIKTNGKSEKESVDKIEQYLVRRHKIILLILDEMDQLESKSQAVLYKIFDWVSWKNSKLVLIGIANDIDLTDRNLPRLCFKFELKPVLLHFVPYTKDEIADILKNCLLKAEADKLFSPGAIELISAKIAGTSGDIRRALDLGKRVVEVADQKNDNLELQNVTKELKDNNEDNICLIKMKRKIEDFSHKIPLKSKFMVNDIANEENTVKHNLRLLKVSHQKKLKSTNCYNTSLKENSNETIKENLQSQKKKIFKESPEKSSEFGHQKQHHNGCNLESFNNHDSVVEKTSDSYKKILTIMKEKSVNKLPERFNFDVDSKDVLSVVKAAFGAQKNFKPNEESSFPLHQKLLICTLLLLIKNGKEKNINVGKLHQVYSKICSKRGLTGVDKSGFLFLCRQVELTGVLQIGKGPGTLAKVTLQWDESEISNSLKDMNMLSSILSDTTCLN